MYSVSMCFTNVLLMLHFYTLRIKHSILIWHWMSLDLDQNRKFEHFIELT